MKLYIKKRNYKKYTHCRFCFKKLQKPVIRLGQMPLAGSFIKSDKIENEKFYPLELSLCQNCLLLQSINVVNKNTIFKNYYYFSSKINTLVNYFDRIALDLKKKFNNQKDASILEIGSNDGYLLSKLSDIGFKVLGIDPAKNIAKSILNKDIKIINTFFTDSLAKKISKKYKKFDAIVSFNTLAHIENMHSVMKGIKLLLKKDGFLQFGVHYLSKLIEERQFDMIYHEHQYYYSIIALKFFFDLYDMEIYNVVQTNVHAGSIVVFVQNKSYGKRKIRKNVANIVKKELKQGLSKTKIYAKFMNGINMSRKELLNVLNKIKSQNKKIVGYGASGRGTIMMNYYGLTKNLIDLVVDDAPAKQGIYTPGNHLKIFPSAVLYGNNKPNYVLLFAWSFLDEIKRKHKEFLKSGGKFIVPLPKIKIISN